MVTEPSNGKPALIAVANLGNGSCNVIYGHDREAVWQPSTVHLHTGAIWDCSAQRGRDVREVSVE